MPDFWEQLTLMFEEEIHSADLAAADHEMLKLARLDRLAQRSAVPHTVLNLAERGVLQWQAECYEKLGRAVYTLLRERRPAAPKP